MCGCCSDGAVSRGCVGRFVPPPSSVMLEMSFETSFIIGRASTGRVEPAGIRSESW